MVAVIAVGVNLILLFYNCSYRNWTTAPAVVGFLQNNELRALPLVLQLAVVQQLSFSSSRMQQECVIHIIRYAFSYSGLLDLIKDPYSNEVIRKPGIIVQKKSSNGVSNLLSHSISATGKNIEDNENVDDIFGASSLMSMLGDDSLFAMDNGGDDDDMKKVTSQECLLPLNEQERVAALTFECFLMVKIRYQELIVFNRYVCAAFFD